MTDDLLKNNKKKKAKPKNKAWVRILNQLRYVYRNRIKIYNFLPSSILHVFLKQASSSCDPVQILLFPNSSDQFETSIVAFFFTNPAILIFLYLMLAFSSFQLIHFRFGILSKFSAS